MRANATTVKSYQSENHTERPPHLDVTEDIQELLR
jgi:hypothetical protein